LWDCHFDAKTVAAETTQQSHEPLPLTPESPSPPDPPYPEHIQLLRTRMPTLLSLLLPLSILFSWLRLIGVGSHRLEGAPIGAMPIPLLARFYMHAMPIGISLITATLLAALDVVSWLWIPVPVVSGVLLVSVPLRYTLSATGIRRSFGGFRRWTEFAGVERAPGGARLKPLPNRHPAHIWLSGSRGDDDFLQLMRVLIRNAYKGKSDITVFPGSTIAASETTDPVPPALPQIAAFQRSEPV
jgi:hypothetical protein